MRQAPSQSAGGAITASRSGARFSNARAPCQAQPIAAMRNATAIPIAAACIATSRITKANDAKQPRKNVAAHHANHFARRRCSHSVRNSTPSTTFTRRPENNMVKASIYIPCPACLISEAWIG